VSPDLSPPPAVRLRGLRKEFTSGGRTVSAVDGVDLDIADGEFLTLLGPSGSGKTTVLRLIAGFERPTAGTVELGGVDVTDRPPFERDVNTVFQDYALFPHMSVADNIGYGLRVRKVARAERTARVQEALESVRLADLGDRRPAQLSGGQRQRVALARALVGRPRVLLLDEPLGALDLKLREQMQVELKGIQRDVGITFVFVTHDQEEALTMSDRIAVFDRGRIEQVGTAADVYERPQTPFVAGFVGTSNLLSDDVARRLLGREGTWSVRPEKLRLDLDGGLHLDGDLDGDAERAPGDGDRVAGGVVREVVYLGSATRFLVDLDAGASLVAVQQNQQTSPPDLDTVRGRRVRLHWRAEHEVPVASPAAPSNASTTLTT